MKMRILRYAVAILLVRAAMLTLFGCAHIRTADRSWEASIPRCDDLRYTIFELVEETDHNRTFVDACRIARNPRKVEGTLAHELCLNYELDCGPIGDW